MPGIRADQLDINSTEFEGAGTDNRELTLKDGGINEARLGFSWVTVEVLASTFAFDGTRSNYTLATASNSGTNVVDFALLLKNGLDDQTRVTTTSAADEWSLSGTTLSVHGDITGSLDSYTVRYVAGTAGGGSASTAFLVGTDTDNGAASLSLNVPAGTTAGDLVVVTFVTRNGIPSTEPGGGGAAWTTVYREDLDSNEYVCFWYKVAGGAEPSAYTLTCTTSTTCAAAVTVYRGVDTLVRNAIVTDSLVTPGWPVVPGDFVFVVWYSTFLSGASQSLPSGLTGIVTEDAAVVNANDQALTVVTSAPDYRGAFYTIQADGGTDDFRRATVFVSFT